MAKPLLFVLVALLASQARAEFNFKAAQCLLRILLQNLRNIPAQAVEARQDHYVANLKAILDGNSPEAMHRFNDVRLVLDLNQMLISYASLSRETQDEVRRCELNLLSGPMRRCEEKYGAGVCQVASPVAVGMACAPDQKSYHGFFCYDSCPQGFAPADDMGSKCRKPQAFARRAYSTREECCADDGCAELGCDAAAGGSFWTRHCPVNFKKMFTYLCVPVCPNGFVDSKGFCLKRRRVPLPNPVVFNFNDLYS